MEEKILELLLDIQARLGRLEEKVDRLEERMEKLEVRMEKLEERIAPAQECVYFKTSAIRFLRFNFAMSSGFSSSSTNTFAVESLYSCSNVS